jgi:hypothetical protein
MSHEGRTELRVEIPTEDMAVIDGYCSGTGKSRTDVIREVLAEWSQRQLHVATVICRVAGRNPFDPEGGRQ